MALLNAGRGVFFVSLEDTYQISSSTANFLKQTGVVIFHKNPTTGQVTSYQVGRTLNSLSSIEKFKGYQLDNKGTTSVNFPNKYGGFGVLPDLSGVGSSSPSPSPTPVPGGSQLIGMNL